MADSINSAATSLNLMLLQVLLPVVLIVGACVMVFGGQQPARVLQRGLLSLFVVVLLGKSYMTFLAPLMGFTAWLPLLCLLLAPLALGTYSFAYLRRDKKLEQEPDGDEFDQLALTQFAERQAALQLHQVTTYYMEKAAAQESVKLAQPPAAPPPAPSHRRPRDGAVTVKMRAHDDE
jgi:hypothetical protein